jgi:uncharacterized protein (DUF1330 family)
MKAYIIADVEVTDPATYEGYKKLTPAAVAAYGGKFVVRGGKVETVEGRWAPQRLVVLEFESMARAKEFWESEEYRPAREIRRKSAVTNMILVEGV